MQKIISAHLVGSLHFVLKRLVNSSACQSNMQTKFKYVFDKCERFALTQNGAIGRAMEKKDDRPEKYEYLTLKLIPTLADLKVGLPSSWVFKRIILKF